MQKAIDLMPGKAELHSNLGTTFHKLGRLKDAEASYRKALAIQKDHTHAVFNLGLVLTDQKRLDDAAQCFLKASELDPTDTLSRYKLGLIFDTQGKLIQAEAAYRGVLKISPNYADAANSLGYVLLGQGRATEACQSINAAMVSQPNSMEFVGNYLFTANYTSEISNENYASIIDKFGKLIEAGVTRKYTTWNLNTSSRIRVGFVSGDFCGHSVSFFLNSLFVDRSESDIDYIAYSTNPVEDQVTLDLKSKFDQWVQLSELSDAAAAETIHTDGIDILVDISGHTSGNRLPIFAMAPAPVQISWLGYPATTGVHLINWIVSDPYASLDGDVQCFCEKIWKLPFSSICFSPIAQSPDCGELPLLSNGYITFGSFNNLPKLNDEVIYVWSKILKKIPNAQLYLKNIQLTDQGVAASVFKRFSREGISADRLILKETVLAIEDHLKEYQKIDIALDTFPYPGVTTSIEAMWMGVPVVTMKGNGNILRIGESISQNAGLSNWIASDVEDYVAKACDFSKDKAILADLRKHLRDKLLQSALLDAAKFSKDFECALVEMWQTTKGSSL
jgi:predicted O-linked N-acetylglucosamine transferase (SPINDLY family)